MISSKLFKDLLYKQGMNLTVVCERYGGGFTAFLSYNSEFAMDTVDSIDGSDSHWGHVCRTFGECPWYPLVSGAPTAMNAIERLNGLLMKYDTLDPFKYRSLCELYESEVMGPNESWDLPCPITYAEISQLGN